jgi:hypothetical protein
MNNTIQKIAHNSDLPNPQTGPVQFGDNYPGMFIRGDDCMGIQAAIIRSREFMKGKSRREIAESPALLYLKALCDDLEDIEKGLMFVKEKS